MTKLVSLAYSLGADEVFAPLFDKVITVTPEGKEYDKITSDCVIIYEGGEDISPRIYGEAPSKHTFAGEISKRDAHEMKAFEYGQKVGARHLGICRGAQLLCALSGGKLIQHVTGHVSNHLVEFENKWKKKYLSILTSSVHHQMMYPFNIPHTLIARSAFPLSKEYIMSDDKLLLGIPYEPEVVYFKDTHALAIQGHPEFMSRTANFVSVCKELVKEFLL